MANKGGRCLCTVTQTSALPHVLVIVAVNASGSGHVNPRNEWVSLFHLGWQTPRRLGDDLKRPCHRIKHKLVISEPFVIEAFDKAIGEHDVVANMKKIRLRLGRFRRHRRRRLPRGDGCGFQCFAIHHVNGTFEQAGDIAFQTHIIVNRHGLENYGIDVDHDVAFAVGVIVPPRRNQTTRHGLAPRPRKSASHAFSFSMISSRFIIKIIAQKGVKKHALFLHVISAQKKPRQSNGLAFERRSLIYAVRPEGAFHQWRKVPPRELSMPW